MFAISVSPPAVGGFMLFELLAYFLIYSCLGWCVEVVYAAVTTGKLVNRGFLNGPVCPIYGFGMIGVLLLLVPLEGNILLLYAGGVILPSLVELVGGWALYKIYHTRWWDYTEYPFNIGGYVCLEFSLLWGVGTLIMVKIIHPIIAGLVWLAEPMAPPLWAWLVVAALYLVYAADVVVTAISASDLVRELDTMEKVADSMRAVSDAMTELLGTTAMDADQKMDESRLQFKLAAAELRDKREEKYNAREAAAAIRSKAEDAAAAARRASQLAKLNASEAANAARLAAQGKAEQAAELLRLQQFSDDLRAGSSEIYSHLSDPWPKFSRRRLMRAFPALKHGERQTTLKSLHERLEIDKKDSKNQ